ncbi:hypothetical protein J437_LFUL008635 [Ladona fulva]|uniref:Uncharacterized protein n=1 Tax=Ladona fulva TaxID=123851 RepID=A0A8K0K557_LADFU|nr:hypothetical protein J437_LFUL008635 [Ladona fulva]
MTHNKSTFYLDLVSGVSSITQPLLWFFQVDGRDNPKLVSVQFERYPVHCGRFSTDGSELLVGSRNHPHFYSYDLMDGKITKINANQGLDQTHTKLFEMSPCGRYVALLGRWGAVHLLTARTKEWVSTLQMTGNVASLSFSSNGSHLYTYGETGEVWVWDIASRSCIHRFADEGSFGGECVAVSPSGRFIACGSQAGIVNLYERDEAFRPAIDGCSRPSPAYTIGNLTTPITSLLFDPTSELLVLASEHKAEAIRIAHLPSRSVYCNFPGFNSKLNKTLCMDISPHGGYLTVGDNKGNANLFRLVFVLLY